MVVRSNAPSDFEDPVNLPTLDFDLNSVDLMDVKLTLLKTE